MHKPGIVFEIHDAIEDHLAALEPFINRDYDAEEDEGDEDEGREQAYRTTWTYEELKLLPGGRMHLIWLWVSKYARGHGEEKYARRTMSSMLFEYFDYYSDQVDEFFQDPHLRIASIVSELNGVKRARQLVEEGQGALRSNVAKALHEKDVGVVEAELTNEEYDGSLQVTGS